LKKIVVLMFLMCGWVFANAQTQRASSSKTIKGSGCVERGVENSCHILIDSKTGETYNLMFSAKVPKSGTAISFTGTQHKSMTTCMQGKPVNVSKWKKEKGIKCPPPPATESTH
jgi:hypothetical protein